MVYRERPIQWSPHVVHPSTSSEPDGLVAGSHCSLYWFSLRQSSACPYLECCAPADGVGPQYIMSMPWLVPSSLLSGGLLTGKSQAVGILIFLYGVIEFRDSPSEHQRVSIAELRRIRAGKVIDGHNKHNRSRVGLQRGTVTPRPIYHFRSHCGLSSLT
jgi:hypothetical protein